MNVSATPMTLSRVSLEPSTAQLKVTLGWSGGNHINWDNYTLNINRANSPTQQTFDGAVREARKLVVADTVPTPSFGKLSPVAGVVAVDDGFAAVRLVTANGFQVPIDGEVANRGGGGNLLQGFDVHAHGTVQALVGATSVLDLRKVPAQSTAEFWREDGEDGSTTIGPWKLTKISAPKPDPEPQRPTPPRHPYVPPTNVPPIQPVIATTTHTSQYPLPGSDVRIMEAINTGSGFSSLEEAISGAREIVTNDKHNETTHSGPFGLRTNVGAVSAIAVMRENESFALYRTMASIDPCRFKTHTNFLFWPYSRWAEDRGEDRATRIDPKLQALVGWSRIGRFTSGDTTTLQ